MHGGYRKPFSFKEREEIERGCKLGLSCNEIAILIGRSKNGVITEVRKNGGKDNYDARIAQIKYIENNNNKRKKLSEINNKSSKVFITTNQKIDHLEMQIEILLDVINDLKDKIK